MEAPRVFISHASEDKERFVLPFAKQLRELGIDAWVDQWEIQAGDSLVAKVFDDGVDRADAFVVVLSHVSVMKPWVREELDAAVIRRIQSERAKRIMPILLDDDVRVPAALKHLKWSSVPRDGLDSVVHDVTAAVYGAVSAPALGMRPNYASTPLKWTDDPQDETVFSLVVDEMRNHDGPGRMIFSNDVQARAAATGVSAEQFAESMTVLSETRRINVTAMAGGVRWMLHPFSDRIWLDLEAERGLDVDAARLDVLSAVVNGGQSQFSAGDCGLGWHALGAVLRSLRAEGMFSTFHEVSGGYYIVSGVSPLARRALR
ncbi:toll/interleukin-1 receptor domain-containing protein [Demequina sp. NBRC 110057]|uniref:toll/interleukin-1 receptor domain-containing protein n=1 Tax=Demequina sp. NBRC 110057 TaxID=1570346 RepID=UPI000A0294BB|nr:toll/interleukin-1 receptor domain-containing protein [Demequina sp. NBRC 110057]